MTKTIIKIGGMARIPINFVDLDKLKKLLTVISIDSGYGNYEVKPYIVDEYDGVIYIPRYYALKIFSNRFDVEFDYALSKKEIHFPPFVGKLRDVQSDRLKMVVDGIRSKSNLGGIINFGTGTGKTVFAIYIAMILKRKTLVIVHKTFLVDQWIKRINEFMPDAKVGRIQQNTCDVEGKHFVIGMVHSLAQKAYPEYIYDMFGTVIMDECHRMAAPMFSLAIPKFNSEYRIGLSATLKRKDGTENVFLWNIGPVVSSYHKENLAPKIKRVFSKDIVFRGSRKIPASVILTIIGKNIHRNEAIVLQIYNALVTGRKILVMSHRIKQLDEIDRLLKIYFGITDTLGKFTVGYYTGGMNKVSLSVSESMDVILATVQMVKEGLDIPTLDTLILATPQSDIIQSVGRILRSCDGKKVPIVVDIVDNRIPLCIGMYKKRMMQYKIKNWI